MSPAGDHRYLPALQTPWPPAMSLTIFRMSTTPSQVSSKWRNRQARRADAPGAVAGSACLCRPLQRIRSGRQIQRC